MPFSAHEVNLAHNRVESGEKTVARTQRIVKQAARNVFPTPPSNPTKFKIYDETDNGLVQKEDHTSSTRSGTSVSSTENLINRTKALTITTARKVLERPESEPTPQSSVSAAPDDDSKFLCAQLERLEDVLEVTESRKGQYRPLTPTSMRNGSLPEHWVTRYVDYTSKYGLGFLLNDGCSGVFFNDSTKIALDTDGDSFQYIERRRTEHSELRRLDVLVGAHTLSGHPESLNKKVTLLKHFRNYLLEQQKKEGDDSNSRRTSPERDDASLVYVKKWLRTKHAILFWLSSNVLQVVFFDQTEVILTEDESSIVYVDKLHRRRSYGFTDQVIGSFPELEKRVKYSRDILKQLMTGQRA